MPVNKTNLDPVTYLAFKPLFSLTKRGRLAWVGCFGLSKGDTIDHSPHFRPRVKPLSSPQPTQDLATIGPQDLWAVWSKVADFILAKDAAQDPVSVRWVLASPGPEGLEEIGRQFPSSLLAALPLASLRHAGLVLSDSSAPGWIRAAFGLGPEKRVALVRGPNGELGLDGSGRREGEVLLETSRKEFLRLLAEGNRILEQKEWSAILDDVRSSAQEGAVKWFYHQRTPQAAQGLERWLLEKAN